MVKEDAPASKKKEEAAHSTNICLLRSLCAAVQEQGPDPRPPEEADNYT